MFQRFIPALLLAAALPIGAHAQISLSINVAPPPLPVYVQPAIPAAGYIWTPGYWRWDPAGADYFWVPGTWIAPPYVGALWTPGYWGWVGGNYAWHGGYWGTHIGFYGGVNYGFGYVGHGYEGGYWNGGVFNYNRSVNNVNTTIVHNVYDKTVVENNTHVSFNGGQGGIAARPTPEENAARAEPHTPPTSMQRQHEQVAMRSPEQHASFNHGTPTMAAVPRPSATHQTAMAHAGGPQGQAPHQHAEGARPEAMAPHAGPRPEGAHGGGERPEGGHGGGEHHEGGHER